MNYNTIFDIINDQLQFQNKLNTHTCGENWKSGITNKNKPINWKLCIDMELSELIDSLPWKHWKNIDQKPDINNIHIELADIWHFMLSEYLTYDINPNKISSIIHEKLQEISNISTKINQQTVISLCQTIKFHINNPNINYIEHDEVLKTFIALCDQCLLPLEYLFALYYGKNHLNEFRQNNGYIEGNYTKIWHGLEDNMVMLDIVTNNPNITKAELLSKLQRKYDSLGA